MTTAMAAIEQHDGFWYEARRYCDERDLPPDSVEKVAHALRSEALRTAIQPFLKIKSDLLLGKIPKMIIHPDGRFESVYEWTEEEKKAFAQVDELVADVAKRYGLSPQERSVTKSDLLSRSFAIAIFGGFGVPILLAAPIALTIHLWGNTIWLVVLCVAGIVWPLACFYKAFKLIDKAYKRPTPNTGEPPGVHDR